MENTNNVNNQNDKDALEKRIAELEEKNLELENNWKRALADYRNFQKRIDEERQSFIDFATISLVRRLLTIIDNLEMVEKHMEDPAIKMILKEFKQILKEENVSEYNPHEDFFDSKIMEAIEIIEGEENKVMEVINKGYFLKDKLIRPARVKVGKGKLINKEEI